MGINPTQGNFKSFTFDGVNSRQYGVYITGEGAFNAPERNVEMIDIAGRNGAFALDRGNFMNIEVTYPASIATDNEADFAEAVSDLRNFLCSKVGYVRLEDDYNPNEYRLAIYKSGLEVSHDMLIAGEFDIVFECKPQRYLKSGETAISVTSGGTITNPTLFDAQPLLLVDGTGAISIDNKTLKIDYTQIGFINLPVSINSISTYGSAEINIGDIGSLNNGDEIIVSGIKEYVQYSVAGAKTKMTNCTISGTSSLTVDIGFNERIAELSLSFDELTLSKGTSTNFTASYTITIDYTVDGSPSTSTDINNFGISYDGDSTLSINATRSHTGGFGVTGFMKEFIPPTIIANSSVMGSGNVYIDCDLGAAYKVGAGGMVLYVNNSVQLPYELPKLHSGANSVSYDNTITSLQITPRWWQV